MEGIAEWTFEGRSETGAKHIAGRADLKSRLVSKKAQKVGTDGNRNRYLAAYMLVYG